MEIVVAIVGVVLAAAIGLPALLYQRRQTKLAEESRLLEKSVIHVDLLERMRSKHSLRVGYIHSPPFSTIPSIDDGQPTGLYVDLIQTLCEREGISPTFKHVRLSSAISEVVEDKVDIVLSIFQTVRRARSVDFTAFLHSVSVSGVTLRQEKRVSSQADLASLPLRFVVCREENRAGILRRPSKDPAKAVDNCGHK